MKLFYIEATFGTTVAGEDEVDALRAAKEDFRQFIPDLRTRDVVTTEIMPDHGDLDLYIEEWGGDPDELDESYFPEEE